MACEFDVSDEALMCAELVNGALRRERTANPGTDDRCPKLPASN